MQTITKVDARNNKSSWYFTGKPCKNGHIAKRAVISGTCYSCNTVAQKQWYAKGKKDKNWCVDRHIKMARNRANLKGIEFNITVEDLEWPDTCPVLGIPIYYGKNTSRWNSPSLDRTDPSKGYTKGNVVVISMRANSLKQDIKPEEVDLMYRYLKSLPFFNGVSN